MTPQMELMMRIDDEIKIALNMQLPKELIEKGGDEDVRDQQTTVE